MKTILIGGASGSVGLGLVTTYLSQGHQVIAVARNHEKENLIRDHITKSNLPDSKLKIIVSEFETEIEIQNLTKEVSSVRNIDITIASLGGWFHGPKLHQLSLQEWNSVINNSLTSHFNFARAVMPALESQKTGSYVMINGGASEYSVPHSGITSVMAAAQKMMTQVLHNEAKDKGIKVFGVGAFAVVKTVNNNDPKLWLTSELIAEYVLTLDGKKGNKSDDYWFRIISESDLSILP